MIFNRAFKQAYENLTLEIIYKCCGKGPPGSVGQTVICTITSIVMSNPTKNTYSLKCNI